MAGDIGSHDASIKVTSNVPVVPERSMYRKTEEGHCSTGTTAPASTYYLAEGTSAWGSPPTCSCQNPNTSSTTVNITYMTASGPVATRHSAWGELEKGPQGQRLPAGKGLLHEGSRLKAIIAERSMYWNSPAGEGATTP